MITSRVGPVGGSMAAWTPYKGSVESMLDTNLKKEVVNDRVIETRETCRYYYRPRDRGAVEDHTKKRTRDLDGQVSKGKGNNGSSCGTPEGVLSGDHPGDSYGITSRQREAR